MKKISIYGVSIIEDKIIDRFKYRGRGRPRQGDYCTIKEAQKKIFNSYNDYYNSLVNKVRYD